MYKLNICIYFFIQVNEVSQYFQDNLQRVYAQCYGYQNYTACQVLANLCVLTFYEYSRANLPDSPAVACEMYLRAAQIGTRTFIS